MKARFMIESLREIEATMKITASIKEWEDLRDQLAEKWPSSRLSSMVTDLLEKSRKVFYCEQETG